MLKCKCELPFAIQGTYFSENEMRERAPLLHHQYIGQYEGPAPVAQVNNSRLSDSILQQHDELQIRSRLAVQQLALEMEEFDEDSDEEEDEDDEQDTQQDPNKQAADLGRPPVPGATAREGDGEATVGRRREEGKDGEEVGQHETGARDSLPRAGQEEGLEPGVGGTEGAHAGTEAVNGTVHISAQQQAENREEFLSIMKARFLAGDEEGVNYDVIDKDASLDEHWAKEEQQDAEDKYFDDV
jgi:hypothetical protein